MHHAPDPHPDHHAPNAPDPITWAALLARWIEFARASAAFPRTPDGQRWKAAVPHIIALSATTHALDHAHTLPEHEHHLALDRAELGITTAAAAIHDQWRAQPLPPSLHELIDDARRALRRAASMAHHLRVHDAPIITPDPAPLINALLEHRWNGTLRIAPAATILFPSEPIATIAPPTTIPDPILAHISAWPDHAPSLRPTLLPTLRLDDRPSPALQIYRQIDPESARFTADLIAPLDEHLHPGRPLLLTAILHGQPTNELTLHDPERWLHAQRAAGVDPHAQPTIHSTIDPNHPHPNPDR